MNQQDSTSSGTVVSAGTQSIDEVNDNGISSILLRLVWTVVASSQQAEIAVLAQHRRGGLCLFVTLYVSVSV